jgi:ribosomal protein S18 acetylase RimI-like enzyme
MENRSFVSPKAVFKNIGPGMRIFNNDVEVCFRAIKPSDEAGMHQFLDSFSDKEIYYRFFTPIKAMPHAKMREYVNVDSSKTMSIVGLVNGRIIAEARYVKSQHDASAEIALWVDEQYQGNRIATYMFKMLIHRAQESRVEYFTADVLATNRKIISFFEKGGALVHSRLGSGVYELTISLNPVRSSFEIRELRAE